MAGHSGRFVCFSEAYLPHAWPTAYQYPTQYDILGIVPVAGGAIVVTNGRQYVASGAQPATMQLQQLELDAGCVSKDSIVDMGDFAIYASKYGLVQLSMHGAKLISETMWPRHEWANIDPASIKAIRLKHHYVFWSPVMVGFCYLLNTSSWLLTRSSRIDLSTIHRGFYDATDDNTYVIKDGVDFNTLLRIELEQIDSGIWESAVVASNDGIQPSWLQVNAESYPITITLEHSNDGQTYKSDDYVVKSRAPTRVASGQYSFFKILASVTTRIQRIVVTNTRSELV